jgi:hypothetical protein
MEASELRIGNFIYIDIHNDPMTVSVTAIMQDKLYYSRHLDSIEYVSFFCALKYYWKSIPLTEYWLVRLGLKKDNNGDYAITNGRKSIRVDVVQDDDLLLLYQEDIGMNWVSIKFADEVHAFQNICFYLIDLELETK